MKNNPEHNHYLKNLYVRQRLKTRQVKVGDYPLGGSSPLRVQSMTNTLTSDVQATVAQCRRLFEAGCDYVRITAQNISEAHKLAEIKKILRNDGFDKPLIADIHFNPDAALIAARIMEKVRINPGNYSDHDEHKTDWLRAPESSYQKALEKISYRLKPLIEVCREYGTALRIGTNHGSLSKRILARYGNTPEGMVQSALEYAGIIRDLGFHDLVLSLKASNVRLMVHAYRLLVSRMMEMGWDYPLHLGVTEAGGGDEGIIKSVAGIGTLLCDGIGDTLRVSLTGDPLKEVPVAIKLAQTFGAEQTSAEPSLWFTADYHPFTYVRRPTKSIGEIGGENPVSVIRQSEFKDDEFIVWNHDDETDKQIEKIICGPPKPVVLKIENSDSAGKCRYVFHKLIAAGCQVPVILKIEPFVDKITAVSVLSALLVDGYGDALMIPDNDNEQDFLTLLQVLDLSRSKAEYISCPTCGRATFNVEKVLDEVKTLTSGFTRLKIAVMGCVVNGPGEMADADYGCVGSAKGMVDIYKGQKVVYKNIPEKSAAEKLFQLIISEEDKETAGKAL